MTEQYKTTDLSATEPCEVRIDGKDVLVGFDVYSVFPNLTQCEDGLYKWQTDEQNNRKFTRQDAQHRHRAQLRIDGLPGDRTLVLSRGTFYPGSLELFGADSKRVKAVYHIGHLHTAVPYHDPDGKLWIVGWGINNIAMPDPDRTWDCQRNVPLVYAIGYDTLQNGSDAGMMFMYGKTQPHKHPLVPAKGKLLLDQAHYPVKGASAIVGDTYRMKFDHEQLPGIVDVSLERLLSQTDELDTEPMFVFKK